MPFILDGWPLLNTQNIANCLKRANCWWWIFLNYAPAWAKIRHYFVFWDNTTLTKFYTNTDQHWPARNCWIWLETVNFGRKRSYLVGNSLFWLETVNIFLTDTDWSVQVSKVSKVCVNYGGGRGLFLLCFSLKHDVHLIFSLL